MASSMPATLTFLADLATHQPGDKVRFLGCVDEYDAVTGVLTLKHEYKSSKHIATVNIDHVREGLPTTATAVASWVNIVGYVHGHENATTLIHATALWEAGPLKLADYERALQARNDTS